jgi:hypothetical protein
MSEYCLLFGCITMPQFYEEQNRAALAALPEEDVWPYLTRDLFALPRLDHSNDVLLITFGTTYRSLPWELWRAKFEALLRALRWYDAYVRLDREHYERLEAHWRADFYRPWEMDPKWTYNVTTFTPDPSTAFYIP